MSSLSERFKNWWENASSGDYTFDWMMSKLFGSDRNKKGTGPRVANTDYMEETSPYIPGVKESYQMAESLKYWNDYERNTGKKPRYPALQVHSPDLAQTVGAWNWWIS